MSDDASPSKQGAKKKGDKKKAEAGATAAPAPAPAPAESGAPTTDPAPQPASTPAKSNPKGEKAAKEASPAPAPANPTPTKDEGKEKKAAGSASKAKKGKEGEPAVSSSGDAPKPSEEDSPKKKASKKGDKDKKEKVASSKDQVVQAAGEVKGESDGAEEKKPAKTDSKKETGGEKKGKKQPKAVEETTTTTAAVEVKVEADGANTGSKGKKQPKAGEETTTTTGEGTAEAKKPTSGEKKSKSKAVESEPTAEAAPQVTTQDETKKPKPKKDNAKAQAPAEDGKDEPKAKPAAPAQEKKASKKGATADGAKDLPDKKKETKAIAALKAMRVELEDLLVRKFFYVPAFEIYGGVAGLYDFGPPGSAIMANLQSLWRQHFVLYENMLEVSCSALTPEIVLKTSGHVDKFSDFMVRDTVTGDCLRADKILEEHVEKLLLDTKLSEEKRAELKAVHTMAGAYSQQQMGEALVKYGVKSPDTGNDISEPFPFNLMFQTSIGPTGKIVGYLRPETAQGIFVNYRRLLEFNNGHMPFAAAQIGLAFRNEISPRSGLIRVREFPLAEIEHFCDPNDKSHPKFKNVENVVMKLLPREDQNGVNEGKDLTIGVAVRNGIVDNETLGYFMARTQLFLLTAGIDPKRLRFRQHKSTEMAHYAKDCWDAEIHTSYGWVECVGHADRAAFDLQMHTSVSKEELIAGRPLKEPRIVKQLVVRPNSGKFGPHFRADGKILQQHFATMDETAIRKLQAELQSGSAEVSLCTGQKFTLTPDLVSVVEETNKISVEKYIPAVIEPSFGLGRIIYALLEHSFVTKVKNGETFRSLHLNPIMAPTKCLIVPLSSTPPAQAIATTLENDLVRLGMGYKIDHSGASIGRKYARADEIGIPFGITIDFESSNDNSVTIRERDTTTQVRVKASEAAGIIARLCRGLSSWAQVHKEFPQFGSQATE